MLAAILAASALMLSVTGYSFLGGNHEVYFPEALRRAGLAPYEGDFFVTQTLQYHGLFTEIAAWLLRLDVARPAFLVIFLALLLATAWAWWRIVRALGGDVVSFLVAVVGYHLLLGDRALGFYSLLQDGQFNAANVAAVALLVGMATWIEGRILWTGLAFGVAGAFHLNYAVVAPAMCVVLVVWELLLAGRTGRSVGGPASLRAVGAKDVAGEERSDPKPATNIPNGREVSRGDVDERSESFGSRFLRRPAGTRALPLVIATGLALIPSIVNIGVALPAKLSERDEMPFDRFVELYVHLRHPHHYDPLSWPWWVWAAFLIPIPAAVMAWRRITASPPGRGAERVRERGGEGITQRTPPDVRPLRLADSAPLPEGEAVRARWQQAARIWLILIGLQLFALLTAGVFWISETFVQLSLWRFSPHAKLLAVSAAAVWIVSVHPRRVRHLVVYGFAVIACVTMVAGVVAALSVQSLTSVAALAACMWWITAITGALAVDADRPGRFAIGIVLIVIGLAPMALVRAAAQGKLPPPGQWQSHEPTIAAAEWAMHETPADALFLLPPDASAFTVRSRRGQVVNFKLVPQLSGEFVEWDRRLREVLDVPDLSIYAGGWMGYFRAQQAMRRRYDELPSEHLFDVARRYGARYVFRSAADPAAPADGRIVWRGADGALLYDLGQVPAAPAGPGKEHRDDTVRPFHRGGSAGGAGGGGGSAGGARGGGGA